MIIKEGISNKKLKKTENKIMMKKLFSTISPEIRSFQVIYTIDQEQLQKQALLDGVG